LIFDLTILSSRKAALSQAVTKRAVLKERCSGSGAPFLFSVDGVWVLS
jgi:hypothetical protein